MFNVNLSIKYKNTHYVYLYVCKYNTAKNTDHNEILIKTIHLKYFIVENNTISSPIVYGVIILWDQHLKWM